MSAVLLNLNDIFSTAYEPNAETIAVQSDPSWFVPPPGQHVHHSSDLKAIKCLNSNYANGSHSLPSVIYIKIQQDTLLFTHAYIETMPHRPSLVPVSSLILEPSNLEYLSQEEMTGGGSLWWVPIQVMCADHFY